MRVAAMREVIYSLFAACIAAVALGLDLISTIGTDYLHGTFYGSESASHQRISETMRAHGEWHTSTATLLSAYLDQNSLMFDIFAGSGVTEVSLGYLVPGCSFASVSNGASAYQALLKNSEMNGIISRSLLLFEERSEKNIDGAESNEVVQRSVETVFKLLYSTCPAVIKFNYPSNEDLLNTEYYLGTILLDAILEALYVIELCKPVIYIENNYDYLSYPIANILSNLSGYKLFWHVSPAINPEAFHNIAENDFSVSMVGVHESKENDFNDELIIIPYKYGQDLLSDYDFLIESVHSPSGIKSHIVRANDRNNPVESVINVDGNTNEESKRTYQKLEQGKCVSCSSFHLQEHTTNNSQEVPSFVLSTGDDDYYVAKITIYLNTILGPFTDFISNSIDSNRHKNYKEITINKCEARDTCDGNLLSFDVEARIHPIGAVNYFSKIAYAKCAESILTLNLTRKSDPRDAYNSNQNDDFDNNNSEEKNGNVLVSGEIREIVISCTEFVIKRFYVLQKSNRNILITEKRSNKLKTIGTRKAENTELSDKTEKIERVKKAENDNENESENISLLEPFNPSLTIPFSVKSEYCGEPIWCDHTIVLQKRLLSWQFPDLKKHYTADNNGNNKNSTSISPKSPDILFNHREISTKSCENSKFLLFQAPSSRNGIGSMIHLVVGAFRFSLCLGRIFVLLPEGEADTLTKWRHPGCKKNTFECYFQQLSGCHVTPSDVDSAIVITDSEHVHGPPYSEEKFLYLKEYPASKGICRMCGDEWTGDTSFFDGLHHGNEGYFFGSKAEALEAWKDILDETHGLHNFDVFLSRPRIFWTSIFMRFILKPQKWFSDVIQEISADSLVLGKLVEKRHVSVFPLNSSGEGDLDDRNSENHKKSKYDIHYINRKKYNKEKKDKEDTEDKEDGDSQESKQNKKNEKEIMIAPVGQIPRPYISLHIRFGSKIIETELQPLSKYMNIAIKKYPYIRNIFVSTETEAAVFDLIRDYPQYNFYFLSYERVEYLSLVADKSVTKEADYSYDFMYSFANLFIAADGADFFLGSLSSSWCSMINLMQRTRGNGGSDYLSVDIGSAYTACF